jgi:DNA topoisomerase-1
MSSARWCRSTADRGSSTVVVIAVVLALALAFAAGVAAAATVDAGARARAAADVAALQAGYEARDLRALRRDPGPACAIARDIVQRHAATLDRCSVDATGVVTVQVSAPVAGGGGLSAFTVRRTARAGPATS